VVQRGETACGAQHHALVVELSGNQSPAAVFLADKHVGGHPDVAVVRGVGVVGAVGQDHRCPGIAGVLGVDDEDRNALVLHSFRVGATGQPDVVGVVSTGGEHLLPIDDVLV